MLNIGRQQNRSGGLTWARSSGRNFSPRQSAVLSLSSTLLWSKVLLLIVAAFLLRPTALGQQYTAIGLFLEFVVLFLWSAETLMKKQAYLCKSNIVVGACGMLLWMYLVIQATVMQSVGMDFVIRSSIANLLSIFVYGLVLGDVRTNKVFFKVLVFILALLGASALVTTLLSLCVPIETLYIGHIPFEGYNGGDVYYAGDVYFPFSVRYGFYPIGGFELPRFTGLLREAGILQAFLLWGGVYALNERLPKWVLVSILAGVVTSLSTAGATLFPATLLFWITYRMRADVPIKLALALIGVVGALVAFLYAPGVGVSDKVEVRSVSFMDRSEATSAGLSLALDNPSGVGLYNLLDTHNAGISLLAATGQIGMLGLLLATAIYVIPLIRNSNPAAYAIAAFPVLATSLLSQPMLDAPLVYVLLLAYLTPSSRAKELEGSAKRRLAWQNN
jgi:hypothetical protein